MIRSSLRRRDETAASELPPTRLVLRGVTVDVDRLAEYDRVCGYRLADTVPVTYPHVLAFPLAMQLMSAPDFPFPVIGLIHVANRITQARPVHVGEPLDIVVWADALRPHERGRQFDITATATVEGVEVWYGQSTYLRRDKQAKGDQPDQRDAEAGQHDTEVGQHDTEAWHRPTDARQQPMADAEHAPQTRDAGVLAGAAADKPPTALWRVGADAGRAYAAVSGDRNPIHVSRIGARAFGFRRPIAHGMWTVAHALAALEGRLADTYTVDVAFRRPLPLPSTVAWRAGRDRDGWTLAVTDLKAGRPHLTGSIAPA